MDHHRHHHRQLRRHGARRQVARRRQNNFINQNGKKTNFDNKNIGRAFHEFGKLNFLMVVWF